MLEAEAKEAGTAEATVHRAKAAVSEAELRVRETREAVAKAKHFRHQALTIAPQDAQCAYRLP